MGSKVSVLDAACKDEKLTAQRLWINMRDQEILNGEERLHQTSMS